jgi:uncharacterized LabA/DUF88 family protein
MLFVDGENLAIEAERLFGNDLHEGTHWTRGTYVWLPRCPARQAYYETDLTQLMDEATRAYYYTSVQGDDARLEAVEKALWDLGFKPRVFKKPKGSKSKGVDITLARDLLAHAFQCHLDVAVLVAGDADYVPLVEEVQRLGKVVFVAFFAASDGLNPRLREASDAFLSMDQFFQEQWLRCGGSASGGDP